MANKRTVNPTVNSTINGKADLAAVSPRHLIVLIDEQNRVVVQHQGITQLESPTLLRMAANVVEKQLGVRE